jgi:hypothetical protein
VKGGPRRAPEGPGGGFFALAVALDCGISVAVAYGPAVSKVLHNLLLALGLGATAPVAMKTISRIALAVLPSNDPGEEGK